MKLVVLLLGFLLMAAPATRAQNEAYSANKTYRITFNHSYGGSSFNVEMRGKVEITDDDKDIKSISQDGYLEISKVTFGARRAIVFTPEGGGIKREYYEGRQRLPFKPEGRRWLGEILPELVRSTTVGAESRVNRFYKKGGVSAVLEEVGRLESSYVRVYYANVLMKMNVTAKDYPSIITKVSDGLDSDHYLTEFLEKNMSKFLQSKEATDAVFTACSKMESDHYKTQVIKEALETNNLSPEALKILLTTTSSMESDHYITEVLTALLRQSSITDAAVAEMINTTMHMESDHYKTIILKKALARPNLPPASFKMVLESVRNLESDHYKTEVITDLLANKLSNEMDLTILELTTTLESDHYVSVVLGTMLKQQELSDEAFKKLVEEAADSDSDHYSSTVLRQSLQISNLSEDKVMAVLQAAGNIESDHYITEVLAAAAPFVKKGNAALKDAYRSAAKRIESETYYGRAMRAIDF